MEPLKRCAIVKAPLPRMVGEFAKRREQFVRDLNRVPGFRCAPPEGAFYAWVNISDTGMSAEEICRIMLEEAGVAAIPGAAFGPAGADFHALFVCVVNCGFEGGRRADSAGFFGLARDAGWIFEMM